MLFAKDFYSERRNGHAVVLGSGTSLEDFDFSSLASSDLYVIAINDEGHRNRDKFTPDAWMFFDLTILNRYREADVPRGTSIFTTKNNVVHAIKHANDEDGKPVPDWVHRIYTFDTCRIWDANSDLLLMHRTTASAATCLAVKMGFKDIALLGVDLYTQEEKYYYTTSQAPRVTKRRARNYISEERGLYMEPRHVKMAHDMTKVKEGLDRIDWGGRVVQTSMDSPLDCFTKMSFEEWRESNSLKMMRA